MNTYLFRIKMEDGKVVIGTTECEPDLLEYIMYEVLEQVGGDAVECSATEVNGTAFIVVD